MRPPAVWILLASALLFAPPARASDPKPPINPEQEAILLKWPQIATIPRTFWADFDKINTFIKTSENEMLRDNYKDAEFQKAVAILVGVGRDRAEPPARGSKEPGASAARRARASEDYFRALARSMGDQPWAFNESGKSAYRRKDFRAAFAEYEAAVKLDPANKEAMLGYGASANELGDYRLAQMAAQQLLARYPGDQDARDLYHFVKGRAPTVVLPTTIFQNGPEPAAAGGGAVRADASAAPASAGPSPSAEAPAQGPGASARSRAITIDAAAALRIRDYPTAHELASQAIALNASNAQALNFRAIASSQMRRYADAVTDASAALALAPGSASALQTRSWAFAKQGSYQEALKDADETLTRDPSNPFAYQAYQNKALALAGLKDRAGAIEALRRSAALDPRYQNLLERALQLPEDQDMVFLFDDAPAAAPAGAPSSAPRRFARLALLSGIGGILIALGILHVVSASWREKVHMTIRRVLAGGPSPTESRGGTSSPQGSVAFWLQYELIKEIGLGGMGVVYEAQDRSLERRVAVKKMREEIRVDPHERRRFINEAKLVAQLRHPNIVDIYAIVEEGQEVYLVFEFVSGRTLHDQIKSDGPMSLEAARRILRASAEAVEHAHAAQIVHRDLKPSNIMIGDDGRVKVMDFGVARQAKDAITKMSMTNTVVGTPPYMAPEQEQGTVRRESDVYALGVCLYEMLTGRLPFSGGGAAMLLNKLNGKHVPPSRLVPSLPAALDVVLAKALAPDPDKRYRTPSDLVAALDAAITAG